MDPWKNNPPPIPVLPVEEEMGPEAELVDPRLPQPPFRWGIVGASGSGKSVLVSNLLSNPDFYGGVFDRVYVFAPTVRTDAAWRILGLPDERTFPVYSDEAFMGVLRDVKQNFNRGWQSLIIFDDLAGNSQVYSQQMSTPVMRYLLHARHQLCSMLFLSQDMKLLPKKLRGNLTAWSLFAPPTAADALDFAKQMGGGVSPDIVVTMIREATRERFGFFQAVQSKRMGGVWMFSHKFDYQLNPEDFA